MSKDEISSNDNFILHVAAIFEENLLHVAEKSSDIEKYLIISTNYCLDYFYK